MVSVRWRKVVGDLRAMRGRVAVTVGALAVSVAGLGAVRGAEAVLRPGISASYLAGAPADATLAVPGGVTPALVAAVRARPDVAAAAARGVVMARVETAASAGADPVGAPLQLFVDDDLAERAVSVVRREAGVVPAPTGALVLERSTAAMLGARVGDALIVTTPHGAPRTLPIAGVVHDPALAPAWQEHKGYAYVTSATLALLGEPGALRELCVRFAPAPATQRDAEDAAAQLARWLTARGSLVIESRVPALRRHPHEGQMRTAQAALGLFSGLLVALSAILVATLLAALLARQVREIGVMKACGARTGQLVAMYTGVVAAIGLAALAIALPLGVLGARAFIAAIADSMGLAIADRAIPRGVFVAQLIAGLPVPLAVAAVPIVRACRMTVRAALAHHGAAAVVRAPRWLPVAARNALRTPGRLALALALLASGGAMAMLAMNVKRAYERNVGRLPAMWHYDVDLWLAEPAPAEAVRAIAALPGVRVVEPWAYRAAARPRPDGQVVVHTYPDQGHGSFRVYGAPADTVLATLPLVAGRWLAPGDTDAIVVSARRGPPVGARLVLALEGVTTTWTVVGAVDALPGGDAFVTREALARATGSPPGARVVRVALAPGASGASIAATTAAALAALRGAGAAVELIEPFSLLRAALDDHVVVVSSVALVLAGIMAVVGLLGLAAALGISVAERTREIGVMKAIGASDRVVLRWIVGEALAIGAASWLVAVAVAVPATFAIDRALAATGFLGPAFGVAPSGVLGWLALAVLGSAAASALPARRAARLTVQAALAAP